MIKYQQLRHALALLEHGNFNKAAQTQNISQPAFSRSIAKLEQSLGVKLFHRHPTGVTTTVYVKILNKYTLQIMTATHDLEREIKIAQGLGVGKLSVALGSYPAELSGHRALGRLISLFPELRCKVTVSSWYEVERLVLNHTVDLGLAETSTTKKNKYLANEPIGSHQCILFCRANHPILDKKYISKKDLNRFPVVLMKVPGRVAPHFPGKLFPEKNTANMIPSVEIGDITLSRQIVTESDAYSAATPLQIKNELEKGIFSVIPFKAPELFLNYGFMYLRDRALSPAAERYMDLVREIEHEVDERNQALIKRYYPDLAS